MPGPERVVLVTGASSGIGNSTATLLAKRGWRVLGTCRDPASHARRADEFFALLPLDVGSDESVDRLLAGILQAEGRIDALVCCAGMGMAGPVEDFSAAEIRREMEINFFGVLRCVKAVLPSMRAAGQGRIVVVSSLAGRAGPPFQALYAASKHALEGLVESLRHEIAPFGIHASLLEPGDFHTGFMTSRAAPAAFDPASDPYGAAYRLAMEVQARDEQGGAQPHEAARLVERILLLRRPGIRYTVGPLYQRLGIFLKRLLPGLLFEYLHRKYYRLP